MNKISYYDRITTSVINSIGGNISKNKAEKLLNSIKAIREGHSSGKFSVKSSIFSALEKKAKKTKNSVLKNKINYEISACILFNEINAVEKKVTNLNHDNKDNIEKLNIKGKIHQNTSNHINSTTTKVSAENKVNNVDIQFRLLVAKNCHSLNINKNEPNVIKKDIELNKHELKDLKRIKDFISVAKAACVLKGLNNNYLNVINNKKEKNRTINFYSNFFEKAFGHDFLKECVQMNEMKTVYSMTGIEEFSQIELHKFDKNSIFDKPNGQLNYHKTVNSVNKKIERTENNIIHLENELKNVEKTILEVEILSAREFIESAKSSNNKGVIDKAEELKFIIQHHENILKEVDDAPKKIAINNKGITALNEVKEILVESYDNASFLRFMSDILNVMKMGNTTGQAVQEKVQGIQNEVKSVWDEAISVKEGIDRALSFGKSTLDQQGVDDIRDESNSPNNNMSFQLPEIPTHDLTDKVGFTQEKKVKIKIVE